VSVQAAIPQGEVHLRRAKFGELGDNDAARAHRRALDGDQELGGSSSRGTGQT
jgi:hypothetical protein